MDWIKKNKLLSVGLAVGVFLLWTKSRVTYSNENFSSCYTSRQIYLNSCDPDQPTGHADVNIEKRFGKMYINIQANLPYAKGGVFMTAFNSYFCFLVDSSNKRSINLGSLSRDGARWYKLATELAGDYSDYDRIDVYIQGEDFAPKKVLTGSITGQQCSSL